MAKIIAVRHAESVANSQGIYQGQSFDTSLSSLGDIQAKVLAEKLRNQKIKKIYTSPLKRTSQTAAIVGKILSLDVLLEKALLETNHGKWAGQTIRWVERNYPQDFQVWQKKPSQAVFPGGEKFKDTVNRVRSFLDKVFWSGTNLLITHDNIIRIMICLAKEISIDRMWEFNIKPVAMTTFKVSRINGKSCLKLVKLNDESYLKNVKFSMTRHAL